MLMSSFLPETTVVLTLKNRMRKKNSIDTVSLKVRRGLSSRIPWSRVHKIVYHFSVTAFDKPSQVAVRDGQ